MAISASLKDFFPGCYFPAGLRPLVIVVTHKPKGGTYSLTFRPGGNVWQLESLVLEQPDPFQLEEDGGPVAFARMLSLGSFPWRTLDFTASCQLRQSGGVADLMFWFKPDIPGNYLGLHVTNRGKVIKADAGE